MLNFSFMLNFLFYENFQRDEVNFRTESFIENENGRWDKNINWSEKKNVLPNKNADLEIVFTKICGQKLFKFSCFIKIWDECSYSGLKSRHNMFVSLQNMGNQKVVKNLEFYIFVTFLIFFRTH